MRKTATAVAALFFTNGAAFASWAPRIPELADRIDVDLAGLGLTLAMVGVGGLAGTPTAGWLIDRIGSRKVASGGAILMSLLIVLVGFAPTPVLLGGALLFVGFFDVVTDLGQRSGEMADVHPLAPAVGLSAVGEQRNPQRAVRVHRDRLQERSLSVKLPPAR